MGTKIPSFNQAKNTLPFERLLANIKRAIWESNFQKIDNALLVSKEPLFQVTTRPAIWSAAIRPKRAKKAAGGEKIQSCIKPVIAPIEKPPKTVINRISFFKFKHKISIAVDLISSCNSCDIYEVNFKNVLLKISISDVKLGEDVVERLLVLLPVLMVCHKHRKL